MGKPTLQHHVVGEQEMGRVLAQLGALALAGGPVVAGEANGRVAEALQIVLDALLLISGERVHRIDQDGRQPVSLEQSGVLDGILEDGHEEALRPSGAGAGGDREVRGGRTEQVANRIALMQEGSLARRALFQHGGEASIQPEVAPGPAVLEGPIRLKEGRAGEEPVRFEGTAQLVPEPFVARPELRGEVLFVLLDDGLDDGDRVNRHGAPPGSDRADFRAEVPLMPTFQEKI